MSKHTWVIIAIAIVFAGGGFWAGMTYAQSKLSPRGQFAGAAGSAFGRTGANGARSFGGGGATAGTIISSGNGTLTIHLPNATTTGATTGTKIVLYDSSTQVEEMQSVSTSNLSAGKNVIITGTPNSDGSITASSIQIRPAGTASRNAPMVPTQR